MLSAFSSRLSDSTRDREVADAMYLLQRKSDFGCGFIATRTRFSECRISQPEPTGAQQSRPRYRARAKGVWGMKWQWACRLTLELLLWSMTRTISSGL